MFSIKLNFMALSKIIKPSLLFLVFLMYANLEISTNLNLKCDV